MAVYSKETALYKEGAIADDILDAGNKAENYITTVSGGGIMVHPESDSTSGWRIASAIELLKNGVTYIKAWLAGTDQNPLPTVRIGLDNGGHTDITEGGMDVWSGSSGTVQLAHIGYNYGKAEDGTQVKAPYFTFGQRATGSGIGNYSLSEGGANVASGYLSHAEGKNSQAIGACAHSEGYYSKAVENYSHAEGYQTEAHGYASHSAGEGTYADEQAQTVVGRFNSKKPTGQSYEDSLFKVGCGTSDSARATAFEVKQNPLGTGADDRLPKIEVNELAPFILIKAHQLETSTMPPDSYTANDVEHDITNLVPDGYDVLNITVSGTGYNCVNVYRLTWAWSNNGLKILYRLRNFAPSGSGNLTATPYVNIILINKGLL